MKFQVEYQQMPYRLNTPHILLIECEDRAEAFITAYHALTERGHKVDSGYMAVKALKFNEEEQLKIRQAGVDQQCGTTGIREIKSYNVVPKGKVLHG